MKRQIICGIYKITNPIGEVYIGKSKDVLLRFIRYRQMTIGRQRKLLNSLKSHGVEKHIFEVIEECDFDLLEIKEIYWISFYNSCDNGLNGNPGGGGPKSHTEDTKKKSGESLKKSWAERKSNPDFYSEEQIQLRKDNAKKSLNARRKNGTTKNEISPEGLQRMINAHKGKSPANKGKKGLQIPWNKGKKGEYTTPKARGKKRNSESRELMASKKRKIVLNVNNGIFYDGADEAAETMDLCPFNLRNKLRLKSIIKNNTPFIYA